LLDARRVRSWSRVCMCRPLTGVFMFCWVPFFTINIVNAICIRYDLFDLSAACHLDPQRVGDRRSTDVDCATSTSLSSIRPSSCAPHTLCAAWPASPATSTSLSSPYIRPSSCAPHTLCAAWLAQLPPRPSAVLAVRLARLHQQFPQPAHLHDLQRRVPARLQQHLAPAVPTRSMTTADTAAWCSG